MKTAQFKYTFPITKAEKRADGLYVTGFASGPEVDTDGERMTPEAIEKFASQINATDDDTCLVYRDAHAPDGVLRDLGDITKAWVTPNFHLGVEVRLDDKNPASVYLYDQIVTKGKQYGMSVAGHVEDYIDEFVESAGQVVRTYKSVVLDEISNTTRPAWYPSFGSVLSKSVKDASETAEDTMSKTAPVAELDATVEDAAEDTTTKADEAVDESVTTEKTDETADDATTEKTDNESAVADVEKGRKVSGATAAQLLGAFETIQNALSNIGVLEAPVTDAETSEKSADTQDGDTTEKSDTATAAASTELDDLRKALEQATARITELESKPTAAAPGAITDAAKSNATIDEVLAKASPSDRLRLAMALHTKGQ